MERVCLERPSIPMALLSSVVGFLERQPFRVLGLSPNPTADLAQLQFEVDVAQRITVRLHTMSGEHVHGCI